MEPQAIATATYGDGPAVVIPWCNYPWDAMPIVHRLAERFLVALVSPRGFQQSARLDPDAYSAAQVCGDVLAGADALDIDEFALLGYSFTAAMGALLACQSTRVSSAIVGGFPLLGDYEAVYMDARRVVTSLDVGDEFAPEAILSCYRDLAQLAAGDLVRRRRCDLLAFRGSDDGVIEHLGWTPGHDNDLAALGIATLCLAGADHVSAPLVLDTRLDDVAEWLLGRS